MSVDSENNHGYNKKRACKDICRFQDKADRENLSTVAVCPSSIPVFGPQGTNKGRGRFKISGTPSFCKEGGDTMEVTWSDLIQFCLLLVGLIHLVWSMTKKK